MIDKELLAKTVEEALAGTDMFVVDIRVSASNDITVELDSSDGMDIDTCADITRHIESVFDRDIEDYSLEVGSAGLTAPFKVRGQYVKNIGNDVEILTSDGRKLRGVLAAFTVEIPVKVKEEGAKRPVVKMQPEEFRAADCKSVNYLIKF